MLLQDFSIPDMFFLQSKPLVMLVRDKIQPIKKDEETEHSFKHL